MLRSRIAILGVIPALALGSLSCAADPVTEVEDVAEDETTLVAADRAVYGTYRAIAVSLGEMPLLVLKTDGTYHRTIAMPCSTAGPCVPAQDDGQFAFRSGARETYLHLYSDTGGVGKYEFVHVGGTIRLRLVGQTEFMSLRKTTDAPWCAEVYDCSVQNLEAPSCAGVWHCGASTCGYACMTDPVRVPEPVKDPDPTDPPGF